MPHAGRVKQIRPPPTARVRSKPNGPAESHATPVDIEHVADRCAARAYAPIVSSAVVEDPSNMDIDPTPGVRPGAGTRVGRGHIGRRSDDFGPGSKCARTRSRAG